jgi:oligopeptide/dipeptide ABC transporter ATP-binding protein
MSSDAPVGGGPLVVARGITRSFSRRTSVWRSANRELRAVAGVDLTIHPGETLGLVGESGSGKSTLGRVLIRLIEPDDGSLHFDGVDLLALSPPELRRQRRHFQMIFQDPYGSLNPRMRVGTALGEPLTIHKLVGGRTARREHVAGLLEQVGLDADAAGKYPHEFSGGQRQRIGIARAIACNPRFIVADEPVSALDPPVQAQIINLMIDLQERLNLAYLFIAHDLTLVKHFCDRVAVMYLGRIVEEGPAASIYEGPAHPYTQALLASTPRLEPGEPAEPVLRGELPSATRPPGGCPFHPRCPVAEPRCSTDVPAAVPVGAGHQAACHLVQPDDRG